MAHPDGHIYWYDPDPRAIIPLEEFHIPRRLRRTLRAHPPDIRVDTAFEAVMMACADRDATWINPDIVAAYTALHRLGFAHSVEVWHAESLIGGLYGVSVAGLFAGESMFSHAPSASQFALVHLVARLRAGGFALLDIQFMTPHLARFGARDISRAAYHHRLATALAQTADFSPHPAHIPPLHQT